MASSPARKAATAGLAGGLSAEIPTASISVAIGTKLRARRS
jgi:hypothetical protein